MTSSETHERKAWRRWASLGESVLSSLLVTGAFIGGALSTVVLVSSNGEVVAPLRGILLVSILLGFGSLLLWWLVGRVAKLLGVPWRRPLVFSAVMWLVSAEERFDRRLRRKDE
jgi:hypothetical protein